MKKNHWVDRLDDKELSSMLSKDLPVKEISYFADNKILAMIRDKEKIILDRKKKSLHLVLRYSLAFSLFIFLGVLIYSLLSFTGFIFHENPSMVAEVKGDFFRKGFLKNAKEQLKINSKITSGTAIYSLENSFAKINIGNNSYTEISGASDLKYLLLKENKVLEKSNIFIYAGKIFCSVNMKTKESIFEIESEALKVAVKGTKFNFIVEKGKFTRVEVIEGIVYIYPKLNVNGQILKNYNKEIYQNIKSDLEQPLMLGKDQSFEILFDDIKTVQEEINNTVRTMENNIRQNKNQEKKTNDILKTGRIRIDSLKNKLMKNDNGKTDPANRRIIFKSEKIKLNIAEKFSEKGTFINSGNNLILLSSEEASKVYAINPVNGQIVWNYSESNITAPAVYFNKEFIVASPESFASLNPSGVVVKKINFKSGPKFWASSIIIDNALYIPGSETVYLYNGITPEALKNLPKASGQIYLTGYGKNLYFTDSNEQKIKVFSLTENRIIWESSKINARIFTSPLVVDNFMIIPDINNTIYRFSMNKSDPISVLKIPTGVVSDIVYHNSKIYFIGLDGYFYEAEYTLARNYKKITKVDNKPSSTKYLTKKILLTGNDIYFSSDQGKMFFYDTESAKFEFADISNNENNPLLSSPLVFGETILVLDSKNNLYKIRKSIE